MDVREEIEAWVLGIHRRNGGCLDRLEVQWRLLEPVLRLDSLDLAEVMVLVERRWGFSPFDGPIPPRTWGELVERVEKGKRVER